MAEIIQLEADAEIKLAQALELRKLLDGSPSLSTALYGARNVFHCIRIVANEFSKDKVWTVDKMRFELLRHGRKYSHAYVAEAMGRLQYAQYTGMNTPWDPPFLKRISLGKYIMLSTGGDIT